MDWASRLRVSANGFGRFGTKGSIDGVGCDHGELWGMGLNVQFNLLPKERFNLWLGVGTSYVPEQELCTLDRTESAYGATGSTHEKLEVESYDFRVMLIPEYKVCDALAPKAFGRAANGARVREFAYECTLSSHLYTARFGLNCLRMYFLDAAFTPDVLERAAAVSGSYYLDMAAAWFFCDALIKRWDETLPYFERGALPREVYLKAVRKAIESFRVPEERKLLLRSLPVPAK